jgi:PPOX class probable F420-dependent enzyme
VGFLGQRDGRLLRREETRLLVLFGRSLLLLNEGAKLFGHDNPIQGLGEKGGEAGLSGALATEKRKRGHPPLLRAPIVAAQTGVRDDGAMPNERSAIAMDSDEIRAFITESRTVVLCTTGPDGVPDPVPMWYVVRDDVLWMRTYAKSQKVKNIMRDPRAALLIEAGERYVELRGVQLTGPLDIDHDVDRICTVFADLMIKYEGLDPQFVDDTIAAYRPTAAKQVALACRWNTPEWRVVSWDHRKQSEA